MTPESKTKNLLLFFILLCTALQLRAQTKTVLPPIETILAKQEDSINVGVACLSLAKEFYPDLNADFLLYAISYLAGRYNHHFGHIVDPEMKVRALNSFLYRQGYWNDSLTFDYDDSDLQSRKRENRFINGYLSTKKGTCITMPMLYLILAERLGMKMYAVRAPNHFFVRYFPENPPLNFEKNIEATSGGGASSDKEYILDLRIPSKGVQSGMYMRTLTKKEYIASLLLINAAEYMESKRFDKAKRYAELALKYDTTLATAHWAFGLAHYKEAEFLHHEMEAEEQTAIASQAFSKPQRLQSKIKELSPSHANSQPATVNEFSQWSQSIIHSAPTEEEATATTLAQATVSPSMSFNNTELQRELQGIRQRFLPKVNKNLEIWFSSKRKAKDMGIALEPPTSFLKKQTKQLKQLNSKGDK